MCCTGRKESSRFRTFNGTGTVEARDLTEYKIGLIEENIARVGNENIITKVSDATVLDKEAIEKADIVIADLPCSGLGVIGNKSDIKYNVTQNQIDELVELQRKILKQVSKYVKQGGKLLYSTCTVNRQENDSNVKWIQDNLPFKLQSLNGIVPEQLKCEKGCLQIYPGQYGMDGFFRVIIYKRIKVMVMTEKKDIKSYNLDELKQELANMGEKPFRAGQIYKWLHIEKVQSFDEMTNISKT